MSAAIKKGWETRRRNEKMLKNSIRAYKAWQTRVVENPNEDFSAAIKKGWETRRRNAAKKVQFAESF